MSVSASPAWTGREIAEVGKCQRFVIWMILLQILCTVLFLAGPAILAELTDLRFNPFLGGLMFLGYLGRLVIWGLCVWGAYRMAKSLRKGVAFLYALAMLVPLIGLVVLVVLSFQATAVLTANGVRVGLMGARPADLKALGDAAETPVPDAPGAESS